MKQGEFELLSKQFATPQAVMTEIINLKAIQGLPKGTEHFLSDLHGESEIFLHILRNASGVIRTKIDLALGKTVPETRRAHILPRRIPFAHIRKGKNARFLLENFKASDRSHKTYDREIHAFQSA